MFDSKKFDISKIAEQPCYDHTIDPFEAVLRDYERTERKKNQKGSKKVELTDHSNDFNFNQPAKQQQQKRKYKSNKQHAEACFDFNAKPISLKKYFADLKVDDQLTFSTDQEHECNQIETKLPIEDSSLLNIQSATEVVLASKIVEDDFVFEYNLDCLFIEPIEDEIVKHLPELKEKFESEDKPSKELFVKRRLFSAVQVTQQIDKEWTEEFFQIDKSLKKIDSSKLFDDNLDSIHELRKLFRHLAVDKHLIRDFFDFSEDSVNINKLVEFGYKPEFQILYNQLISMYVVFNDENFIRKRDSTIHQLDERFKFLPFNFSIKHAFNSIGIGFFDDFFPFTKHIRLVAPFVAGRFKDKVKKNRFIIERWSNTGSKRNRKTESEFLCFDKSFDK